MIQSADYYFFNIVNDQLTGTERFNSELIPSNSFRFENVCIFLLYKHLSIYIHSDSPWDFQEVGRAAGVVGGGGAAAVTTKSSSSAAAAAGRDVKS